MDTTDESIQKLWDEAWKTGYKWGGSELAYRIKAWMSDEALPSWNYL